MADAIFGLVLLLIVLLLLLALAVMDAAETWKKLKAAEKENERLRGLFIDERRRAEKAEAERDQAAEHVRKCTETREEWQAVAVHNANQIDLTNRERAELRDRAAQYQHDLARQAKALADIRRALISLKGGDS